LFRKWINQHPGLSEFLSGRSSTGVERYTKVLLAVRHYKNFVVFKEKLIAVGFKKRYRSQRRLVGWCGLYRAAELIRRKQEVFIKSFRQLTDSFAYFSFNQVKEK